VRTSVEPLDGNRVRLSIELEDDEFDEALDAAFRKIAREVRVPGFRPGKAPRRLIEARLGTQVARQEALRDALPEYYERALEENDLTPIAPPEIDITAGQDEGPVAFDAVVEVMPMVSVAGYEGLRVVLPSLEVDEDDVEGQIDELRKTTGGELRAVPRPARDGDHVSIDRKVTRHDETLQASEDELYEVGSGTIVEELDRELRGKRSGDILKFNATVPDHGEVTFTVLVKEVREVILPEVTDEWASEASEFDTVDELREDIRNRLSSLKRLQAALQVRDRVLEALVELVDEEMPPALVDREVERRLENLEHRLSHQGAGIPEYLQARGISQHELIENFRNEAVAALKADLALQAVAEMEAIEVTDAEVEAEIEEIARRRNEKPAALRRRLQSEGELPAVRSGLRKTKALEWLAEHTEYVDEDGRVIDRPDLELRSQAAAGSDDPPAQQDSVDAQETE
jgi:trigger factor